MTRLLPATSREAPASSLLFVTPALGRAKGGLGVSADRITRGLARGSAVTVFEPDPVLPRERFEERGDDTCGRRRVAFWHGGGAEGGQFLADLLDLYLRLHGGTHVAAFYAAELAQPAIFAARLAGVPGFVFGRGNDVDRGLFAHDAAPVYWALAHADTVFAVSSEMARKIAAAVPAARVAHVPNAVDTAVFAPAPCAPPAHPSGPLTVGLFGQIKAKKGLVFLLEALDFSRFTLCIAGTLTDDARKLLHGFLTLRPELAPKIAVEPYLDDEPAVSGRYHAVDIVALPSIHDGMANVLVEAMASARVCVATAVGGAPDLLRDGENGYLCAPRDPRDLAAALDRAAAAIASGDGPRIGDAARRAVIAAASLEAETAAYRRLMRLA